MQVARWKPELKVFSAAMSGAETLALRLFNYPAWKVEVNGHCVDVGMREGTGQMLVPVGAGANLVQISFVRTWDRRLGAWVSGISVLLVLIRKRYSTV